MKSALLVTGGSPPPYHIIQKRLGEFSFLCAADSGLDTMRSWKLVPNLIVGDMDSLADQLVLDEYADVERHPEYKDYTDTELGVRALRDRGYSRIVIAGGGAGRIDHLLAIFALFNRADGPDEWLTHNERLVRIRESTAFATRAGSTVSVFPLAKGARDMRSEGLEWALDGLAWQPGDFGVSNIATGNEIRVFPGQSPLVIILPLEEG